MISFWSMVKKHIRPVQEFLIRSQIAISDTGIDSVVLDFEALVVGFIRRFIIGKLGKYMMRICLILPERLYRGEGADEISVRGAEFDFKLGQEGELAVICPANPLHHQHGEDVIANG